MQEDLLLKWNFRPFLPKIIQFFRGIVKVQPKPPRSERALLGFWDCEPYFLVLRMVRGSTAQKVRQHFRIFGS